MMAMEEEEVKIEVGQALGQENEDNIVAVAEMSTVVVSRRQLWPSSQMAKWTFEEFALGGPRLMLLHFFCLWFSFFQQLVEFYLFCVNW